MVYCCEHCLTYRVVELLCCILETGLTLCSNYFDEKEQKQGKSIHSDHSYSIYDWKSLQRSQKEKRNQKCQNCIGRSKTVTICRWY